MTLAFALAFTSAVILGYVAEWFRRENKRLTEKLVAAGHTMVARATAINELAKEAADLRIEIATAKAKRCKPRGSFDRGECPHCHTANVALTRDGEPHMRCHSRTTCDRNRMEFELRAVAAPQEANA